MTADREVILCLRDMLREALLVRKGEVVTEDLALERANNAAQAIAAEFDVRFEEPTEPIGRPKT